MGISTELAFPPTHPFGMTRFADLLFNLLNPYSRKTKLDKDIIKDIIMLLLFIACRQLVASLISLFSG